MNAHSSGKMETTVYRHLTFHPVIAKPFVQMENTRYQSRNETLFFQ